MTGGLLSWNVLGATLAAGAAGCVGYVGFTVAQVASLATADDPTVAAVADPPPLAPYAARAAAADAPSYAGSPTSSTTTSSTSSSTTSPTTSPATSPVPAAARPSGATSDAPRPSRSTDRPPAGETDRTRSSTPARTAARPATRSERQRQLEIKHARWADRQLAAMLRATAPALQWFGGAAWVTPVADYHLTARFGESGRLWSSIHTGLDFAAPTGTPVRAATAGTVTSVGWAGAYGNKIEITHPDGSETWYAHLSRTDVRVGAQVGTGALIGAVGATGNVTGSHLHFEVRPGGDDPVDPAVALEQHGVHP